MLFQISKDFVNYNYHIVLNIIIIVRKYKKLGLKKYVISKPMCFQIEVKISKDLVNNFDEQVCYFKPMCFQIELDQKSEKIRSEILSPKKHLQKKPIYCRVCKSYIIEISRCFSLKAKLQI